MIGARAARGAARGRRATSGRARSSRAHPEWVAEFETGDEAVLFDVDVPGGPGAGAEGRVSGVREKVLIKGAGEQASATAHRLFRCGYRVAMTDLEQPTAIRRTVVVLLGDLRGRDRDRGRARACCSRRGRGRAARGGVAAHPGLRGSRGPAGRALAARRDRGRAHPQDEPRQPLRRRAAGDRPGARARGRAGRALRGRDHARARPGPHHRERALVARHRRARRDRRLHARARAAGPGGRRLHEPAADRRAGRGRRRARRAWRGWRCRPRIAGVLRGLLWPGLRGDRGLQGGGRGSARRRFACAARCPTRRALISGSVLEIVVAHAGRRTQRDP